MKKECRRDYIMRYFDGELNSTQKEWLKDHIQICDECKKFMKVLSLSVDYARERVILDKSFAQSVMKRIDNNYKTNDCKKVSIPKLLLKPVALLTSVLFILFLGFVFAKNLINVSNISTKPEEMSTEYKTIDFSDYSEKQPEISTSDNSDYLGENEKNKSVSVPERHPGNSFLSSLKSPLNEEFSDEFLEKINDIINELEDNENKSIQKISFKRNDNEKIYTVKLIGENGSEYEYIIDLNGNIIEEDEEYEN